MLYSLPCTIIIFIALYSTSYSTLHFKCHICPSINIITIAITITFLTYIDDVFTTKIWDSSCYCFFKVQISLGYVKVYSHEICCGKNTFLFYLQIKISWHVGALEIYTNVRICIVNMDVIIITFTYVIAFPRRLYCYQSQSYFILQ